MGTNELQDVRVKFWEIRMVLTKVLGINSFHSELLKLYGSDLVRGPGRIKGKSYKENISFLT